MDFVRAHECNYTRNQIWETVFTKRPNRQTTDADNESVAKNRVKNNAKVAYFFISFTSLWFVFFL